MEDEIRKKERSYYQDEAHARDYDRRAASERKRKRYHETTQIIKRYATAGSLLDIGCGPARMLVELARALPRMTFTGADVSEEMLKLAARNVEDARLTDRIALMRLPAEDISELPEASYDVVLSQGSFSGWLAPLKTLTDVNRILKAEGILIVRDWNRAAPAEHLKPYLDEAMGNPEHTRRVRMAYESSYTDTELRKIIKSCPLGLVDFTTDGIWMTAVLRKAG